MRACSRILALFLTLGTSWAQEAASALPSPVTTSVEAFEKQLVRQEQELQEKLVSLQASLAETRTASIPGLVPTLRTQEELLAGLRGIRRGQLAALQQSLQSQVLQRQIDSELTRLRETGMPTPPPYAPDLLDRLLAEARQEESRLAAARSTEEEALKRLEASLRALEESRRQLEQAQAQRAGSQDPTALPLLGARVTAAELATRRAEEDWRLRELEHRNRSLERQLVETRRTLLAERTRWVEQGVAHSEEALEKIHRELDKQAFDLRRSLQGHQHELREAERRWSEAHRRRDQQSESDPVLIQEVQTRFAELQGVQRKITLVEARLERLEAIRRTWQVRFAVARGEKEAPELETVRKEVRTHLAGFRREEDLQEARLAELLQELQDLGVTLAATAPGSRQAKLLGQQQDAVRELLRAGEANRTSLRTARLVEERLLQQLPAPESVQTRNWWRSLTRNLRSFWEETLGPFAAPLLHVLLLLFLGLPLNLFLSRRVQIWAARLYNAQSGMIAGKVLYYGGLTLIAILFLNRIGVGLAPLLGAAGVTGVALGFASQTSVSNIISGLFLIAEQPFQVEDIIVVGDVTGVVLSIDLLSVKLRQFDNRFVRIPNETILKTNVVNISRHPIRRTETRVSVAYRSDLEEVTRILRAVADEDPDVLQNPEPLVIFQQFGDSGIDFKLCCWGARENFLVLANRIPLAIKRRFDEAGIEIPFHQVTLHRAVDALPFEVRTLEPEENEEPGEPDSITPPAGSGASRRSSRGPSDDR